MPFFHAQYIVQSKFPFTLFHEKAIGVKEEDHSKDGHNAGSQVHHLLYDRSAVNIGQVGIGFQRGDDIVHHDCQNTGHDIWKINPAVLFHRVRGQFRIEKFTHDGHHLSPEWSEYRKSSDITPGNCFSRDKSDERFRRP